MVTRSNNYMAQVGANVALGSAIGGAVGSCYGTFNAFKHKIPGLLKIRYIGRATVSTAVAFGLFMGAGSLIHSGRSK